MYTRYLPHHDREYTLATYETKKFEKDFLNRNRNKINDEKLFYRNWLNVLFLNNQPCLATTLQQQHQQHVVSLDSFDSFKDSSFLIDFIQALDTSATALKLKKRRTRFDGIVSCNSLININGLIECLNYLNKKFQDRFATFSYHDFLGADRNKILSFLFLIKYCYETPPEKLSSSTVKVKSSSGGDKFGLCYSKFNVTYLKLNSKSDGSVKNSYNRHRARELNYKPDKYNICRSEFKMPVIFYYDYYDFITAIPIEFPVKLRNRVVVKSDAEAVLKTSERRVLIDEFSDKFTQNLLDSLTHEYKNRKFDDEFIDEIPKTCISDVSDDDNNNNSLQMEELLHRVYDRQIEVMIDEVMQKEFSGFGEISKTLQDENDDRVGGVDLNNNNNAVAEESGVNKKEFKKKTVQVESNHVVTKIKEEISIGGIKFKLNVDSISPVAESKNKNKKDKKKKAASVEKAQPVTIEAENKLEANVSCAPETEISIDKAKENKNSVASQVEELSDPVVSCNGIELAAAVDSEPVSNEESNTVSDNIDKIEISSLASSNKPESVNSNTSPIQVDSKLPKEKEKSEEVSNEVETVSNGRDDERTIFKVEVNSKQRKDSKKKKSRKEDSQLDKVDGNETVERKSEISANEIKSESIEKDRKEVDTQIASENIEEAIPFAVENIVIQLNKAESSQLVVEAEEKPFRKEGESDQKAPRRNKKSRRKETNESKSNEQHVSMNESEVGKEELKVVAESNTNEEQKQKQEIREIKPTEHVANACVDVKPVLELATTNDQVCKDEKENMPVVSSPTMSSEIASIGNTTNGEQKETRSDSKENMASTIESKLEVSINASVDDLPRNKEKEKTTVVVASTTMPTEVASIGNTINGKQKEARNNKKSKRRDSKENVSSTIESKIEVSANSSVDVIPINKETEKTTAVISATVTSEAASIDNTKEISTNGKQEETRSDSKENVSSTTKSKLQVSMNSSVDVNPRNKETEKTTVVASAIETKIASNSIVAENSTTFSKTNESQERNTTREITSTDAVTKSLQVNACVDDLPRNKDEKEKTTVVASATMPIKAASIGNTTNGQKEARNNKKSKRRDSKENVSSTIESKIEVSINASFDDSPKHRDEKEKTTVVANAIETKIDSSELASNSILAENSTTFSNTNESQESNTTREITSTNAKSLIVNASVDVKPVPELATNGKLSKDEKGNMSAVANGIVTSEVAANAKNKREKKREMKEESVVASPIKIKNETRPIREYSEKSNEICSSNRIGNKVFNDNKNVANESLTNTKVESTTEKISAESEAISTKKSEKRERNEINSNDKQPVSIESEELNTNEKQESREIKSKDKNKSKKMDMKEVVASTKIESKAVEAAAAANNRDMLIKEELNTSVVHVAESSISSKTEIAEGTTKKSKKRDKLPVTSAVETKIESNVIECKVLASQKETESNASAAANNYSPVVVESKTKKANARNHVADKKDKVEVLIQEDEPEVASEEQVHVKPLTNKTPKNKKRATETVTQTNAVEEIKSDNKRDVSNKKQEEATSNNNKQQSNNKNNNTGNKQQSKNSIKTASSNGSSIIKFKRSLITETTTRIIKKWRTSSTCCYIFIFIFLIVLFIIFISYNYYYLYHNNKQDNGISYTF